MLLKKILIILSAVLFLCSACQESSAKGYLTVTTEMPHEESTDQYVDEYDLLAGAKHTLRNAAPYGDISFEIARISENGVTIKTGAHLRLFDPEEEQGVILDEIELEYGVPLKFRTTESGWGVFYTFELSKG